MNESMIDKPIIVDNLNDAIDLIAKQYATLEIAKADIKLYEEVVLANFPLTGEETKAAIKLAKSRVKSQEKKLEDDATNIINICQKAMAY